MAESMEPWHDNLWRRTARPAPTYPPLGADATADVAIIGAGYTGLAAALRFASHGRDVIVLEAQEPGFGASGRNTGWWVPFWTLMTPEKALERFGEADGGRFCQMMIDAGRLVSQLVTTHAIECDIRQVGVVCAARTPETLKKLQNSAATWRQWGAPVDDIDAAAMRGYIATDRYIGGIIYRDGGQLQPLDYCRGLAAAAVRAGVRIHGQSPVIGLSPAGNGWRVTAPMGTVKAQQVLLATNAFSPIFGKMQSKFLHIKIAMIASEPFADQGRRYLPQGVAVADVDSRDAFGVGFDGDGRLVTSVLPAFRDGITPAAAARPFWRMFRNAFPDAPERVGWQSLWHGHICVPSDALVKTEELSPGLFAAYGYSGNGIAQASMVGTEMADWMATGDRARLRVPPMALKSVPFAGMMSLLINRLALPALSHVVYR